MGARTGLDMTLSDLTVIEPENDSCTDSYTQPKRIRDEIHTVMIQQTSTRVGDSKKKTQQKQTRRALS